MCQESSGPAWHREHLLPQYPWTSGLGAAGGPPNRGTQQRTGLAGLDSLFLEEAGTFGERRRFLPEGQRGGKPVHGVGRKEGRVEEHEKSQSPFGFWTGLLLMGGSRFPVLHEPLAPSAAHSFAFSSSPRCLGCLRPCAPPPPPPPPQHLDIFSALSSLPSAWGWGEAPSRSLLEAPRLAGGGGEGRRDVPCSWEGSTGCRSLWQMGISSHTRSNNLILQLWLEQRGEGGGPCPSAGDGSSPSAER